MDQSTQTPEEPKKTVTVEEMVKTQQAAHNERMMVTLHILERLAKIETQLETK
jgi:hypothetical protein